MKETLINSLVLTLVFILIVPAIGFLINLIATIAFKALFALVDNTGTAFAFFHNRLTFIGVMIHEFSHALFAFVTGARITDFKLYHKEENRLGYVNIVPQGNWAIRSIQMALTACGPVITGLIIEGVIIYVIGLGTLPWWGVALLIILLFIPVLFHMDMSGEDLKGYLRGVPFFFILFFLISFVMVKFGVISRDFLVMK